MGPSMIAWLGLEHDDSTADHLRNEITPNPAWLPPPPARMVHHAEGTNPRMERHMIAATPKTNEAALAAFMAGKAEIDPLLARIAASSDDHFGTSPDRVTWGDAGSLGFIIERLKEITEFLGV